MQASDKWHTEGRRLQHLKQTRAAEDAYRKALRIKPDRLDTLNNLIVIFRLEKRFDEAEELFLRSVKIAAKILARTTNNSRKDSLLLAWIRLLNSGSLLALEQRQHTRSRKLSSQQILLDPEGCGTINLGIALDAIGKNSAAARSHTLGLLRHGVAFEDPTALVGYKLSSNEQSSQLHKELCNLATCLLKQKPNKTQHWKLLLARLGQETSIWSLPKTPWYGLWNGEHCKTLLVWDEQGYGDAMQCLRWIPFASTRATHLILMLRPSLIRLVKKRLPLPESCQIIPMPNTGLSTSNFGYHCPVMALPVAMADGNKEIPNPIPSQGHWLKRWKKTPNPRKQIGLVWRAGIKNNEDAQRSSDDRSIPAHLLMDHAIKWASQWRIELLSLQREYYETEIVNLVKQGKIKQLTDFTDWETTAELIEQIDLVISVDTAIVHLAGNLGIPCLLLLNKVHDWRWGSMEKPTSWYPNQTVLRCRHTDHWKELLEEADSVVEALLNQ